MCQAKCLGVEAKLQFAAQNDFRYTTNDARIIPSARIIHDVRHSTYLRNKMRQIRLILGHRCTTTYQHRVQCLCLIVVICRVIACSLPLRHPLRSNRLANSYRKCNSISGCFDLCRLCFIGQPLTAAIA